MTTQNKINTHTTQAHTQNKTHYIYAHRTQTKKTNTHTNTHTQQHNTLTQQITQQQYIYTIKKRQPSTTTTHLNKSETTNKPNTSI